jgi:predicted dienelactone hydrolase
MRINRVWTFLVVLLSTVITHAAPYVSPEPAHKVATLEETWMDPDRNREVPVLICYPLDLGQALKAAPVIVFSHGLGATRESYKAYGLDWAAKGYFVVFPQHHGSDSGVIGHGMRDMLMGKNDLQAFIDRVKDIHFVIDQIEKLSAGKLDGPHHEVFANHLDLTRIGMSGHSFGAITTQAIVGQHYLLAGDKPFTDSRVKAGIAMSGSGSKDRDQDRAFGSIKIPVFYLTGTEDKMGNIGAGERRTPFDHSTNPDTFLLTFNGATHMTFGPRGRLFESAGQENFQRLIRETTTAFWDAYLKDEIPAKQWFTTELAKEVAKDGVFEIKAKATTAGGR